MKLLTLSIILTFSLGIYSQCKNTSAQRAAFSELPIEERIALWNAHLLDYEASHMFNLTPEQLTTIERARLTILPTVYEHQDARTLAEWRRELRANFSLKEGSAIFEQLPDYVPGIRLAPRPGCDCNVTWTFCMTGSCSSNCYSCGNCAQVLDCGPFWAFLCNGRCVID